MNDTQKITVTDRERVEMNTVISVLSFDEEYMKIETTMGIIAVEGIGLKMEGLSKKDGSITVSGAINGIYYLQRKRKGKEDNR